MFKNMTLFMASLTLIMSAHVPLSASYKPAFVGSVAGITGGIAYSIASGFGAGSITKGFVCSGVPLAIVTALKAGVNQTEDAGLHEYQKKSLFITNSTVGTITAFAGALVKCFGFVALTGGMSLAMAYAGPNASPIYDLGSMVVSESAQFLAGSALAGLCAHHCW